MLGLNPRAILDGVHTVYKLKAGSDKKPDQYLGADIGEMHLANGEQNEPGKGHVCVHRL